MGCRIVASVMPAHRAELEAAARAAAASGDADLLEVRCDRAGDEYADWLGLLTALPLPAIVTLRPRAHGGEFAGDEAERTRRLAAAARIAAWVDVEAGSAAAAAPNAGVARRIVSHHDWSATPRDLDALADELRALHPDALLKLVVTPRDLDDVARCATTQRRLAAAGIDASCFALGELGAPTRLLAGKLGAALVYGALDGHAPTAPGQPSVATLARLHRVREQTPAWAAAAVVGDPIAHSLSPLLHSQLYRADSLARAFVPMRAPDLAAALRLCDALGIGGVSVTLPHKQTATRLASGPVHGERWPPLGGATNTLVRGAAGWHAANSDAIGFAAALAAAPPAMLAALTPLRTALLLGAGGAARTALVVLRERGVRVTIAARRPAAARALADEAGRERGLAPVIDTVDWERRGSIPHQLLVNATPIGMAPASDESPFPAAAFRPDSVVLDLVYRPRRTRLLREAEQAGAIALDGVTMFVAQALAQHRHFTGQDASPAAANRARAAVDEALDATNAAN